MPALSPTHASTHITNGISEYLTTSFSLAEPATAAKLRAFLEDPTSGIFHGPYVRTRLPYAPATEWEGLLDVLPDWFTPYKHQAEAFRRLRSFADGTQRRPEPTLVVTGTGSGKTESFLYPILDHCKRMRAKGVGGMKALILYPMNALANDQERRLAALLTDPESGLGGITAGIYTGESATGGRTCVAAEGLISDRTTLRDNPPDILLTNYKMLDQLLLREADAELWSRSATTLQYLVLDEFHTYDGAQGTDVALLLRRLGLKLKSFQPAGFLSTAESDLPLGRITPVATSATLGSGESGANDMVDFAYTVFGQQLDTDAIVGETLLTLEQWQRSIPALVGCAGTPTAMPTLEQTQSINHAVDTQVAEGLSYPEAVHEVLCQQLFACSSDLNAAIAAASQNELVLKVLHTATTAVALEHGPTSLVESVFQPQFLRTDRTAAVTLLTHILAEIAYLRSSFGAREGFAGKKLPGVETHLWVREVSRLDRAVSLTTSENDQIFRWSDDGVMAHDAATHWLPAIYCRHCGRSGWMLHRTAGEGFEIAPQKIRRGAIADRHRQLPLIDASSEAAAGITREKDADTAVKWLNMELPELTASEPSDAAFESGHVVPVLTYSDTAAEDLARSQTCPSCGNTDSIRYLGAAVATLLSVGISNLFGQQDLDDEEKKTLVFADSVQDAAHRAGFIQGRARTFALRSQIRAAVTEPISIDRLPDLLIARAEASTLPERAKFELLPPQLNERQAFRALWDTRCGADERLKAVAATKKRLALDLALEFGDRADLARSLVSTGALTVRVALPDSVLQSVINALPMSLGDIDGVAWATGVLEAMRLKGGINHPWFTAYLKSDANPFLLNRREARAKGMPPFARGGAPHFPRAGAPLKHDRAYDTGVLPLGSPRGFFAHWTARALGIARSDASHLVTALFAELASRGHLTAVTTRTGGTMYALEPSQIELAPVATASALECDVCQMQLSVAPPVAHILDGSPCFTHDCTGHFTPVQISGNYYRNLYRSSSSRSVVAREHTGLLETEDRLTLENSFKKNVADQAANSPNVLVATPTLEMGIDIGDLSTVMLSSMPKTVANYVQRVGRAGRLSGNSLIVALIRGRGEALARLEHPLDTIAGSVGAPAAYLSARDILHRQFFAYLLDTHTLSDNIQPPRRNIDVFSFRSRTVLDEVASWVEAGIESELDAFCATLTGHTPDSVQEELRQWATQDMVGEIHKIRSAWSEEFTTLLTRQDILNKELPELKRLAELPTAEEEDKGKYRAARSAKYFINHQLKNKVRDEYWISGLERYGLLPNFTLLDTSVEFQMTVSSVNYDTSDNKEFSNEIHSYTRGISTAIHELAPGATFYVKQTAAKIDSVEIGPEGTQIQQWRFCPQCSYSAVVVPEVAPGPCPSCGSIHFADQGQIIDVVEMTKVYATVDQERSSIDTFTENRQNTRYQTHLSFVILPGGSGRSWFLQGSGFGVHYLPSVDMRWVNLGMVGAGQRKLLADAEVEAPLFRVCRHCGHIDSEADRNSWKDHKAWCPHRHAAEEDSVSFALARSLSTQGVLLHIPALLTSSDSMTLPSLIAALKLGFKRYLGGDPSHLDVGQVRTVSAGKVVDVLLLHDTVPGGTGYLAQFSEPQQMRALLETAYTDLAGCNCANDGRLSCPDCLLPFAGQQVEQVSRAVAVAALHKILSNDLHPESGSQPSPQMWEGHVMDGTPDHDDRSELEARFLEVLRADLKSAGATIKESMHNSRSQWTITFQDSPHIWMMEEQVDYGYTKPDFMFSTDAPFIRNIALFLDGEQFHIDPTDFRFPGDIDKRNKLYRDESLIPWAMTWQDLDARTKVAKGLAVQAPSWYNKGLSQPLATLFNLPHFMLDLLALDPMTQLLAILKSPTENWAALGKAVLFQTQANSAALGTSISTDVVENSLRLSVELSTSAIEPTTWNSFLELANLFYLQPDTSLITVNGASSVAEKHVAAAVSPDSDIPAPWQDIIAEFAGEDDAQAALRSLATAGAPLPSSFGSELGGIPTIALWEAHKVALVFDGEADEFTATGYTVWEAAPSFNGTTLAAQLKAGN